MLRVVPQQDRVGQARLTAVAAPSADSWLKAVPSWNQDTLLSNAAFRDSFSTRLGIRVFEGGLACSFCQNHLDAYGLWTPLCELYGTRTQTSHAHLTQKCGLPFGGTCRRWAHPGIPHLLPDIYPKPDLRMCCSFRCLIFNNLRGEGFPNLHWTVS